MKQHYTFLLLFFSMLAGAQIVNIPNAAFKARLLAADTNINIAKGSNGNPIKIDINNDLEIQESEALLVYQLRIINAAAVTDLTGIAAFTNLRIANFSGNSIASADLTPLVNLQTVNLDNNELTSLSVNGLGNLTTLSFAGNQVSTLNTLGLNSLTTLDMSGNNFVTLNFEAVPVLSFLYCSNNGLTSLNLTSAPSLMSLDCSQNSLSAIDVSMLSNLYRLECYNNALTALDLSENTGITYLNCSNNGLTSLDLNGLSLLDYLKCSYNQLTSLTIAEADPTDELYLDCSYNQLMALNIAPSIGFSTLICSHNQLILLNLDGLSIENVLNCSYNQLSTLNTSGKSFYLLECNNNLLTYLNVSNCNLLEIINCSNNLLTTLDVSTAYANNIDCNNNALISLFLKGGSITYELSVLNNPDLQYVCINDDEDELAVVQDALQAAGNTTCEVNSYCVFTPGAFYTIQGTHKYDITANGCDAADPIIPATKLNITNGTVTGTVIDDESGNYSIRVQSGTHTITPVFSSPYYQISPPSFTVTFPGGAVPLIQDFCITADGEHPDVDIALIPGNTAVPGFNNSYTIRIKNKGTVPASGTMQLVFDDAVMNFISALPSISGQSTNTLNWNYTNLPVFGVKEFIIAFSLNTPTDTPPLNQDDILPFTATVNLTADEMPGDNVAVLNQMVFNAFDPNDKICLEGDTITPNMVGEYVHYRIRFENTGNYPAAIVTVKDVIDTSKFDIETLMPVFASHPFITRITNGNQVEFVFDNIMLPIDDFNNDGYVIFKIKTKPTLVLGDELSNTAGIYFNYNAPVITNTAVTTVAIPLGIDENNDFGFALYPNPVKDVLNISSKVNAHIDSVVVYNMLGQELMKVLPSNGDYSIDVSRLPVGSYIIKVFSDNRSWSSQFLKQN